MLYKETGVIVKHLEPCLCVCDCMHALACVCICVCIYIYIYIYILGWPKGSFSFFL